MVSSDVLTIQQQQIKEEQDTWEQRRTKRKKDPLIDISCKLRTVLNGKLQFNYKIEPFKKEEAWIPYNDHYIVANHYYSQAELDEIDRNK